GKVAIATDQRGNHLPVPGQRLLQEPPWSNRARLDAHRGVGFFFPTQATEKGIQVVHDTQCIHQALLLLTPSPSGKGYALGRRSRARGHWNTAPLTYSLKHLQPTGPVPSASRWRHTSTRRPVARRRPGDPPQCWDAPLCHR